MPLLRAKQGPRGWSVELGVDGMLEGCEGPEASTQASTSLILCFLNTCSGCVNPSSHCLLH